MKLQPEDRIILLSVKIELNAIELEEINSLIPLIKDWDYLVKTIIDRGIGPLLFKKLPLLSNSSQIPENVKTKLQQSYYKTFIRSAYLYEHFKKVAEAFLEHNIPVIALKGVYLSECLYQDIGLRQFSDIDLLVKEENGLTCLSILEALGIKPFDSNVTDFIGTKSEVVHYNPMVLNDVSVEIHIKLHRKNKSYHIKVDKFLNDAVPVTINEQHVKTLSLNDLLIYLCVHLDKHFTGGNVQFTSFNDITNLLSKYENEIDWVVFTHRCKENECEMLVYKYLILINKYFNAPLPNDIIQKYLYLLKESDDEMFYKYLHGVVLPKYFVTGHLENISQIHSFPEKVRYLFELIFPPRAFMIPKYGLDPQLLMGKSSPLGVRGKFWWLWYPYRWWIGVKGVIRVIKNP